MLQKTKELEFRRITEFEGLRAILAWWVFLGHALVFSGFTDSTSLPVFTSWLLKNGYAVDIFIILSGFVIFLLLDTNPKKSYLQFLIERFFRIYPIFIIALLAGIASMPLQERVFRHAVWNDPAIAQIHLRIIQNSYDQFYQHLISHIFLLHGMIPDQLLSDSSLTFVSQAWTLSLEWQFYLIAPAVILVLKATSSKWLALSFLVGAILSRKLFSQFSFGFGSFLPINLEFFAVGILSYYFYKSAQKSKMYILQNNLRLVLFALIICGILFTLFPHKVVSSRAVPITMWFIVLSASIARSTRTDIKVLSPISNFLNHPLLQSLGKISYSTYLIHLFVIYPLMWLIVIAFPDTDKSIVLLVQLLLGSILTVAISFILYRFVEKPFIYLGKQVSVASAEYQWNKRNF